jgi:hypothetical protein
MLQYAGEQIAPKKKLLILKEMFDQISVEWTDIGIVLPHYCIAGSYLTILN